MAVRLLRRRLLFAAPLALLLAGGAGIAARMMEPPPADLDLSLAKASEHQLYIAALTPDRSPVPVGTIHSWTLRVTTTDGRPATDVALSIDGGMPQHGHGLPTRPAVTRDLGNGDHIVEGMKFNMGGWWTLSVSIDGPAGADTATFNLVL